MKVREDVVLAFVIPLSLSHADPAKAEDVYRCPGPAYQQAPCEGGRKIVVDPGTNAVKMPKPDPNATLESHASGPWVATLPMPPRMVSSPMPSTYPHVQIHHVPLQIIEPGWPPSRHAPGLHRGKARRPQ